MFSFGPLVQGVVPTTSISTSSDCTGSDVRRVERKTRSLYEAKYETHERGCTLYLGGDGRMMEMYSEGERAERESAESTTRIKTGWILKNKLCLTKKSIGSGLLRRGGKEGHGQGLTSRPSTTGSSSSGLGRAAENGMGKGRNVFDREETDGVLSPAQDLKGNSSLYLSFNSIITQYFSILKLHHQLTISLYHNQTLLFSSPTPKI